MITIKDFMEVVDYRITEGSNYQWQCFGPDAYCLDSWNGEIDGHTVTIIFDTRSQTVYQAMAYDYSRGRAYRMTNPEWKEAFDQECEDRDILDMAWEDDEGNPVKYVDLEVEEDFLEKARAIVNYEDYDTRVQIPLTLNDDELYKLMRMAHERDITFNQLVEELLQNAIDAEKMRQEYDFSQGIRGDVQSSTKELKKQKKGKK